MGLPVLPGIIRMPAAPFLLAIPAELVVLGIALKLTAVLFPATLPLAIRSTANKLVGTITGKLKQLVAVATAAITYGAAPDRNVGRPL